VTRINVGLIEYDSPVYLESVSLRQDVLRTPLGLKFTKENMVTDEHEYHIAASDGDNLVGILLLRPLDNGFIKMRQVAVREEFQGKGIGQKLVEFAEEFATGLGFNIMELHARKVSLNFYERLNYAVVGEQFEEIGIPHFRMEKNLV